jgi:hypothetical protein
MLTTILAVVAIMFLMGLMAGVLGSLILGEACPIRTWFAIDVLRCLGSVVCVLVQAIVESQNS